MIRNILSFLLMALIFASFLGGCASVSNYQTAEVLEEGETQATLGLSFTEQKLETGAEINYEGFSYFTPEFILRGGISESFDFGVKLYMALPIGVVIDGKYQFLEGEKWDMAFDLGLGYSGWEAGSDDTGFSITEVIPSVLITYHLSENVSATLAPKALVRRLKGGGETDDQTFVGGNLTLSLGKRFMPEFGYFKGEDIIGQDVTYTHFGVGINF